MWQEVWGAMEIEMDDIHVFTLQGSQAKLVSQLQRGQLCREGSLRDTKGKARSVLVNQWSKRHVSKELSILIKSLRDGSLWRACHQLAAKFEEGGRRASYSAVSDAMIDNGVILFNYIPRCARCARVQVVSRCFL